GLILRDTNWLGDVPLATAAANGLQIFARVRSSQPPRPAVLYADQDGAVRVMLAAGQEGVAAGQACVFYSDDDAQARVLGGGWIARTLQREDFLGDNGLAPENAANKI